MDSSVATVSAEKVAEGRERILTELRKVIVGQDEVVEQVLIALFTGGHCLITGVPGPGEDAPHQDARRHPRSRLQADPVHARHHAVGHHRHRDPRRGGGHAPAAVRQGADLRADHPGRRDQPHAAQDAGGAARGDAGVSRHRRGPDLPARSPVLRARDAEPDRARRHLSAARSAARSLHVQRRHQVPERRRRGDGGDADDRRRPADAAAGAERPRHPAVPGARAAGRDRRGDRALHRAARRRVAARACRARPTSSTSG